MNSYKYYDTPDGKDLVKKMAVTGKYAGLAGLIWSTYDVMLISHPQGYAPTLSRYLYFTGPLIGMSVAYTTTTYAATKLRDKDDYFNALAGGVAAGAVYGAWQKCGMHGFAASMVLGVVAMLKKRSTQEGWDFFPTPLYKQTAHLWSYKTDFTLIKERPKSWTSDPKEA